MTDSPEARDMASPIVLAVSAAFDIPQVEAAYALATLELDGYDIGPAADLALAAAVRRVFWVDGPTGLYWQAARHAIEENIRTARMASE